MFDNIINIKEIIENIFSKLTKKFESFMKSSEDNYYDFQKRLGRVQHFYVLKPADRDTTMPNAAYSDNVGEECESLTRFYSGAELNIGDIIYGYDNHYYPMNMKVVDKVYSVNNNTTYLFVKNVANNDYIYTSSFKPDVICLFDNNAFIDRCMKRYKSENNIVELPDKFEGSDTYYRYVACMISEELEKYSAIDFNNRLYRVIEILAEHCHFEWHRPTRWEFSND